MAGVIGDKRGIALVVTYVIITVLIVSAAPFFWRSFNEFRFAQRQRDETKAYYASEAALTRLTMQIYQDFKTHTPSPEKAWSMGPNVYRREFRRVLRGYSFPISGSFDDLDYTVILPAKAKNYLVQTDKGLLLRLIATATVPHLGGTVRKVMASTISYEVKQSPVFNYGYFINNFGNLGRNVVINGDARSNGNFSFDDRPRINGDIYAAENPALGTAGTITGRTRNWDIENYQDKAPASARPTNPTGTPNPGGEVYDAGHDGKSDRYEHQQALDMPYLGDLEGYKRLATDMDGTITKGNKVLVDNVYSGVGPDGENNTPDDGCIVLIGTKNKPIVINGPVVVDSDVIIKGWVEGQGTIYSGRNIHIVGNVVYKNAPSWPKPDKDPSTTAAENKTKDFLGLSCKGNVIIGNYTAEGWKKDCEPYLKPPFTQGYEVDETDAPLGYDSDGKPKNGYWFDGDYTAVDDKKGKDDGTDKHKGEPRMFYESSLSDDYIDNISADTVKRIDAIIYNNHAFAGDVTSLVINGAVVSRDDAIVYSNRLTINYDIRAHSRCIDSTDINIPRSLILPETKARQSG